MRRIEAIFWGTLFALLLLIAAWAGRTQQLLVDLTTGRQQERWLLGGLCIYQRVHETAFSNLVGSSETPHWRIYFESSLLSQSPCFTHGATVSLFRETLLVGDELNAPADERRRVADQILERVQRDDLLGARRVLENWRADRNASN